MIDLRYKGICLLKEIAVIDDEKMAMKKSIVNTQNFCYFYITYIYKICLLFDFCVLHHYNINYLWLCYIRKIMYNHCFSIDSNGAYYFVRIVVFIN